MIESLKFFLFAFRVMNPHIEKLYPKVKKIHWTSNVVRGGNKFGDQPKVPTPHLDVYQNDEFRIKFHEEYPVYINRRK